MMTAEQLKRSILQLAIQGKLVEQRLEEGTGEEQYKEIQVERKRLIKEGKIKNQKPLPAIKEEEALFVVPDSWMWVRLGNIIDLLSGIDFKPSEYSDVSGKTVYITGASCFSDNGVISQRWTDAPRNIVHRGDLLIVCKGSGYGKTVICNIDEAHIARQIMSIKDMETLELNYIRFYLQSQLSYLKKSGQGVIPGIDRGTILNMAFPLPPLAEQKRIVTKIEELMPFVEQYATASIKLNTLNATFPEIMKKSILQEAVQGKLVPQDPNDEPASLLLKKIAEEKKRLIKEGKIKKQKPLPEITEDEIPFDIPESWEWVRLNDCMDVRDGTHDSPKYHSEGYPLVTSKNLRDGRIDFSTCKLISKEDFESINQRSRVDSGDILFAMIGTVGNPVLFHGKADFSIKNMALFKHIGNYLNMEYVYWFLSFAQSDMKKQATGGVQNFVSLNYLRNYLIPIPPANEQGNIVKAIERIIPELNNLMV